MGSRGKVEAREKAREKRLEGKSIKDIAEELGVSKSSVSKWVRDVAIERAVVEGMLAATNNCPLAATSSGLGPSASL